MKTVIRHLRRAALLQDGSGPSDKELLGMFLARRDEAAFEVLMRRHGPMVLGVCRRVLRNAHDAEDAFQATFLVLVRKAGSLRSGELLSHWLYGVAYRTAMKARAMNAKRRTKESQAAEMPSSKPTTDEDMLVQLDQELTRLPEKYRVPVILCELEGKSRKEAARLLGLPEGTLSWRLAQAKKLLARKLSRFGAVALAALLCQSAASACLTPALRTATLKAAFSAGAVPAQVLALTEGVMKAMLLTKLKITACAAALMLLAGVGASGLTYRATAQSPQPKETLANRSQADELEALRLEIEALRKSLQATRERVKTLEDDVSALKRQRRGPQGIAPAGGGRPPGPGGPPGGGIQGGPPGVIPAGELPGSPGTGGLGGMRGGMRMQGMMGAMKPMAKADPVTEAESALKKLRENPGDKQATEALERALKRLKEQEKPNVPGKETPPER